MSGSHQQVHNLFVTSQNEPHACMPSSYKTPAFHRGQLKDSFVECSTTLLVVVLVTIDMSNDWKLKGTG